jgi:hypothetical protein
LRAFGLCILFDFLFHGTKVQIFLLPTLVVHDIFGWMGRLVATEVLNCAEINVKQKGAEGTTHHRAL